MDVRSAGGTVALVLPGPGDAALGAPVAATGTGSEQLLASVRASVHGSLAAAAAKEPKLASGSLLWWVVVRFADPVVEEAYAVEQRAIRAARARYVGPTLACILALHIAQLGVHEEQAAWANRILWGSILLCMLLFWLLGLRRPALAGRLYGPFLSVAFFCMSAIASMSRDRWATLLALPGRAAETEAAGLMEATSAVILCGVLTVACTFVRLSSWSCLLMVNWAVGVYMVIVCWLGSLEYRCIADHFDIDINNRVVHHAFIACNVYIIGILVYMGRRDQEIRERRSFATMFAIAVKLELDEALRRQRRERQREREEMIHGFALVRDDANSDKSRNSSGRESPEPEVAHHNSTSSLRAKAQRVLNIHLHSAHANLGDSMTKEKSGRSDDSAGSGCLFSHKASKASKDSANGPRWGHEASLHSGVSVVTPSTPRSILHCMSGYTAAIPEVDRMNDEMMETKTVPYPAPCALVHLEAGEDDEAGLAPNAQLVQALAGKRTDWDLVDKMASQIRHPMYSLKEFFEDCLASFPELGLFTREPAMVSSSSGRSAEAEYQRTIGALFAVYWLLRLDIDGKESICNGVDAYWRPIRHSVAPDPLPRSSSMTFGTDRHSAASGGSSGPVLVDSAQPRLFVQMSSSEKRLSFLRSMNWAAFSDLVSQAGCAPGSKDSTEGIVAMLCLTAFHDIMKLESLLPVVQASHAPYHGYNAGETIHDHDIALSYVLEKFPSILPSYAGLPEGARRRVLFTQVKLGFNHGWFVQAEGPPGMMLSAFKAALAGGAKPTDIGFYFFHWITDLSGSEATPLGGAEKFVLRFPHKVLAAFLWSIPFLGQLASMSETEVFELYLRARWQQLAPGHPIPAGKDAIARMRLAVMAQGDKRAADFIDDLPPQEQQVLRFELARTGCRAQTFSGMPRMPGPAFLVYYGPALLQQNADGDKTLRDAILALARILHGARCLWPEGVGVEDKTVLIQVADVKASPMAEIVESPAADTRRIWVLVQQSDWEGAVHLLRPCEVNALNTHKRKYRLLDLSPTLPLSAAAMTDIWSSFSAHSL